MTKHTCNCGAVEYHYPLCACVPCHHPKPFSSMDRSNCVLHGPRATAQRATFLHADAKATCATCGDLYEEHAADPEDPVLIVLCDGTRAKL